MSMHQTKYTLYFVVAGENKDLSSVKNLYYDVIAQYYSNLNVTLSAEHEINAY